MPHVDVISSLFFCCEIYKYFSFWSATEEKYNLLNLNTCKCVNIDHAEIVRIGDGKKIVSLEVVPEEQLVIVVAGRQRQVKLIPVRALAGDDVEWIKVKSIKKLFFCISNTGNSRLVRVHLAPNSS